MNSPHDDRRRNGKDDASLEQMESKMHNLKSQAQPPSEDFRERLKSRLLEARSAQRMSKFSFERLFSSASLRPFAYAMGVLLLVAVVASQFVPFGPGRGKISRLLISDAYAAEFDLAPADADAAGSAPDSSYLLTAKTVDVDAAAIEASLAVQPDVPVTVEKTGERQWRIDPKEPLAANTIFKVTLAATVAADGAARDFEWAFQVKDRFKVLTSIPRDRATYVPTSLGVEVTFSHPDVQAIERHFSIEPAVEGRFETHGRTVVFVPNAALAAKTLYTVRVSKGLGFAGSDETLAEDYVMRFETSPDMSGSWKHFQASRDLYEFAASEVPTVQINRSENAGATVAAKLYRYDSPDAFLSSLRERDKLPWWSQLRNEYLVDVSAMTELRSFEAAPESTDFVEYVRFPEALPRGFYLAELTMGGLKDQVWIQVSDASAYVQTTITDTLVWVNSLATKGPISGAKVQIDGLSPSYATAADGTAVFPTPKGMVGAYDDPTLKPEYLKVAAGPDTLIVPASSGQGADPSTGEASGYWRYLYTDRPLYQTNDVIKFWGVAKARADGKPIAKDLTVTLSKEGYVDYAYRPTRVLEQAVTVDPQGTITGELAIKNLKPDYYTMELRAGDTVLATRWLNISPYVKPAYELTMTADREALYAGETVKMEIVAKFFDGTPVPNLPIVVRADSNDSSQSYRVVTDASGKAGFVHGETYAPCAQEYECWPRHVWFNAHPEDAELAEIQADATVRFYGPRVYATSDVSYPAPGRARFEAKIRQIDIPGMRAQSYSWEEGWMGKEPAPKAPIELEVVKQTYLQIPLGTRYDFIEKVARPTYRYELKTEIVETVKGNADDAGVFVYERDVEPETTYAVRLKASDAEGRTSRLTDWLWYYDGRTTWQGAMDDGFEYWYFKLPEDKPDYSIGETVEAQFVRSGSLPAIASGKRYLFMQLHLGLQERVVTEDPVYRFRFEARDVPNVNLAGVYFNGKTYLGAEYGWSYGTSVRFKQSDRALTIETKADKPGYKPGEAVKLDVRVTDAAGKPVAASVNLNLIDEAYYAVAADTADPLSELYASVTSGGLYTGSSHLPSVRQNGGAEGGGCFLAGTEILMADGTVKAIEDVRIGDEVATLGDPATARRASGRVTETFRHVVRRWLVVNGHLKVTPEHLVYTDYTFRQAGELKIGDWLLGVDGKKVPVVSIETHEEIVPVYNFTVDPFHTYIAEGLYVHNDKGGGPRQVFTDAALFRTVATGNDGRASVAFTLPDNLTSWRVTSQAVGGNLLAGSSVSKIPVSLPVFVEATIGKEYLVGDRAVAKVRAFGAALTSSDEATFEVSAPSLGLAASSPSTAVAKAFTPADVPLPAMTLGRHDVTFSLKTAKGGDSVLLPVDAVASRLQRTVVSDDGTLTVESRLTGEGDQPLTVVLSDVGQNRYYRRLERLASSWTDRVDQAVARPIARGLLNEWYGESAPPAGFEASRYQLSDGGVALLPYAASDLALTVRVAATASDRFDRAALAQYFFAKLESRSSTPEEVTLALAGLASLGEPVLARLGAWEKRTDLDLSSRLAIAQAYADLGAGERARSLLGGLLKDNGRVQGSYIWMEVPEDTQSERADIAVRAAVLASRLGATEREGLWAYAQDHRPKDRLLDLEEVAYIRNVLPKTKPSPAKVAYLVGERRYEAALTGGRSHTFVVQPQEIGTVRFESVEGSVAYAVRTLRPATALEGRSSDVSIAREYFVNGKATTSFKDGDVIEVRLTPKADPRAPGNTYQVTDLVPSGLTPIARLAAYGVENSCASWRPYGVEGQRVTFLWHRGYRGACSTTLTYYARVTAKGTYKAEPAMIQSYDDVETFSMSTERTITIE